VDLLRLRRESTALGGRGAGVDGAVLSASAFALRFCTPDHHDDHLLMVNLGSDLFRESFAEPLLAPPLDTDWTLLWSSENPAYGGGGTPDVLPDESWRLPGESAIVLSPGARRVHKPWPKNRRTA
jgi:maltooligosyltrehalose trehalohydrolase